MVAALCILTAAASWLTPPIIPRARPAVMSQTLTEKIMSSLPDEQQSGGAGGATTYEALLRLDENWAKLRAGQLPPTRNIVVEEPNAAPESAEFDLVVCGGNIGILLATALVMRGLRVAVLEAGTLRGRSQDWNASRKEVMELVEAGVLSKEEAEEVIGIEFNPVRCGFAGGDDVWLTDVLNVGVKPEVLIAKSRARFEANGGKVLENSPLASVAIRPGAAVLTTRDGTELRTRLVIDCMGQRSPIVAQVRGDAPPDGVCVVVGSCADGYAEEMNTFGDVIFADTTTQPSGASDCPTQYFWEAFPASASNTQRTTYLFTYMDLDPKRPSVLDIMEDYWRMLPAYQGVSLDYLEMKRVLFGLFTSYKDSPLPIAFDRIMQIGDAGGLQSPLSFGGFGAITRHIGRLTSAVESAIESDALMKDQLSSINPYQPNLRAAWLFQASMRPPVTPGAWSDDFISKVLVSTFEVMEGNDEVMLPFLQDTLRVDGLAVTIGGLMLTSPLVAIEILVRLGPIPLADWFLHFSGMILGSALGSEQARAASKAAGPLLPPSARFATQRFVEGWQYGSGLDYTPPTQQTPMNLETLATAKAAAAKARAYRPAEKEVAAVAAV